MTNYNRFGAAYTDVIARYPGTQASDYGRASGVADATAGQTAIEEALDRYSRRVMSLLPESVYKQLTQPRGEVLKEYTLGNETSFTTNVFPIVSGSVHLYEFDKIPNYVPCFDDGEVNTDDYTVTEASGTIAYTPTAAELAIIVHYDVDTTNASYSVPSLAEVVVTAAAAEMGARLYFGDTQRWGLVERYEALWAEFTAAAKAGEFIPDEVRLRQYAIEPTGPGTIGSVIISRG